MFWQAILDDGPWCYASEGAPSEGSPYFKGLHN